jgi:hypothetical protein
MIGWSLPRDEPCKVDPICFPLDRCQRCGRKLRYRQWTEIGDRIVLHAELYCPKGHDPASVYYAPLAIRSA